MNALLKLRPVLAGLFLGALVGCAGPQTITPSEGPLRAPTEAPDDQADTLAAEEGPEPEDITGLVVIDPPARWPDTMRVAAQDVPESLPEGPFSVNFESIPLPMFIDEIFGRLLELSYQMDEGIRTADDLVTLRLVGASSGPELYRAAMRVLARYGVSGYRQDELFYFAANPDAVGDPLPLLATGRALPSVPETHRPVFQVVPLAVVRNTQVRNWLQQMFSGRELEIMEDPERNAIILKGTPSMVRQAMSAIEVLDQPNMRGQNILRIDPAYRGVADMAEELEQLLGAQGYQVASGSSAMGAVMLVPVKAINALFVFAASDEVLAQARQWAAELDRIPTPDDEDGIFRYRVQNTSAESIAGVLRSLVGDGDGRGPGAPEGARDQRERRPGGEGEEAVTSGGGLVVDTVRNAILYRGSGQQWQRLRPLIVEMDTPTPMVLVEVTIAEITLSDQFDLGVEGVLQELDLGSFTGQVSTVGGLGLGGSGLSATFENPGDARLVLNAFSSSERVNILSRPHLLVKSGTEVAIDVGTEVPIITSQASTADFDSPDGADILQEVTFRETGVLLNVMPIVRGRGVVDLIIEQEVSEAQQTETSNINSPSIFTRRISTELTARDGRALLMGGLISESRTDGTAGVPGLSRIPLIGRLFRVDGKNSSRTELAVMLIPYVLPSHEDAETITESFRRRLAPDHPGRPVAPVPDE